jgi:hypothetical protein
VDAVLSTAECDKRLARLWHPQMWGHLGQRGPLERLEFQRSNKGDQNRCQLPGIALQTCLLSISRVAIRLISAPSTARRSGSPVPGHTIRKCSSAAIFFFQHWAVKLSARQRNRCACLLDLSSPDISADQSSASRLVDWKGFLQNCGTLRGGGARPCLEVDKTVELAGSGLLFHKQK